MKRIVTVLCALVLLITSFTVIPVTSVEAEGESQSVISQVADDSTVNNWEKLFSSDSTEHAGGVWTDKSVFTSSQTYIDATHEEENEDAKSKLQIESNNFLVSLSAIASTKSIVGYSSIPTDTMLVLDMSTSMINNKSIDELTIAANKAMQELLSLNNHNRVGVVIYAGNITGGFDRNAEGATVVLLPLDRYTSTTDVDGDGINDYLNYSRPNNRSEWNTMFVVDGVKNSDSESVSGTKSTSSGTFIQDGIYVALQQFLRNDIETTIPENQIQAGTERIPIMVIMTDGEPTLAVTDYDGEDGKLGANELNFQRHGYHDITFLSQLTASYAKQQLDSKYLGETPLFYTLGLNVDESEALVMNPDPNYANADENLLNRFNGYWNELKEDGTVYLTDAKTTLTYDKETIIKLETYRSYSDGYYKAENEQGLLEAFEEIVAEIILQSMYYPTLVEGDAVHGDGYLTFTDFIGHNMEVKEFKGIQLGENLYDGHKLAKLVVTGSAGTTENPTEIGDNLVWALTERLGLDRNNADDKEKVRGLLAKAYNAGQISYNASTGEFSNYVGWFGNERGQYLGFWDGTEAGLANEPDGAVAANKSYLFLDAVGAGHRETDILYASVQVSKAINSYTSPRGVEVLAGESLVYAKFPASLIPLVEYHVELEGSDPTKPTSLTVSGAVAPSRLIYEVGLNSKIDLLDLENTIPHKEESKQDDGSYVFYTNQWKSENFENQPWLYNTYAMFEPSKENEHYYFNEKTLIYSGVDTPAASLSGNGPFYRRHLEYKIEDGTVKSEYVYTEVSSEVLKNAKEENGQYFVDKGTIHRYVADHVVEKETNPNANKTNTIDYSSYPYVHHTEAEMYHVDDILGNNGKLVLDPYEGIKLSKLVDSTLAADSTLYEFTLEAEVANGDYTLIKEFEGVRTTETVSFANGSAKIYLKANETAYLLGSALAEKQIKVTESESGEYKVSVITGGELESSNSTNVTVSSNTITPVTFTNTKVVDGDVIIEKTVVSDHDAHKEPDKFDFTITLEGNLLENAYDAEKVVTYSDKVEKVSGKLVRVDSNPNEYRFKASDATSEPEVGVKLGHNDYLHITGLKEETKVKAVEADYTSEGFTTTLNDSHEVTVATGETKTIHFTNTYAADKTEKLNYTLKIVKNINTTDFASDSVEFKFSLDKLVSENNQSSYETEEGFPLTMTMTKGQEESSAELSSNLEFEFTRPGNYSYRVVEIPSQAYPGIVYDSVECYFTVVVTDPGDGKLVISDVIAGNDTVVDKDNHIIETKFNNQFVVGGSAEVVLQIQKTMDYNNIEGVSIPLEGFVFEIYETNSDYSLKDSNQVALTPIATVQSDAVGRAPYAFVYYKEDNQSESTKLKDHYYVIKEKASQTAHPNGILTYDETFYRVHVKAAVAGSGTEAVPTLDVYVFKNNDTELYWPTTQNLVEGDNVIKTEIPLSFVNQYTPNPVSLTIPVSGIKNFTGWPEGVSYPDELKFKFELSHRYTKSGESEPTTEKFAELEISAEDLADNNWTFIFNENGEHKKFTKPGEYTLVLKESAESKYEGVSYDSTEYEIFVTVTADDNGKLHASITNIQANGKDSVVVFNNSYSADPVEVKIQGTKKLISDLWKLNPNTFSFDLYEADKNYAITNNTPIQRVNNGESVDNVAPFEFTLNYAEAGTYYYVIKEVIPSEANADNEYKGITFDSTEYKVYVQVTDNGSGVLKAVVDIQNDENEIAEFTNQYSTKEASVVFEGTKHIEGALLEGTYGSIKFKDLFEFEMYEAKVVQGEWTDLGNLVATAKIESVHADSAGTFKFASSDQNNHAFTYNKPGDYYYIMKEKAVNDDSSIVYDPKEYYIRVNVADNLEGKLEAHTTILIAGQMEPIGEGKISYSNLVHPEDINLEFSLTKELKNWSNEFNAEAPEFNFNLYQAKPKDETKVDVDPTTDELIKIDANPLTEEIEAALTQSVKGSGNMTFADLSDDPNTHEYNEATTCLRVTNPGIYYYIIEEEKPTVLNGIEYDETKYIVKVNVTKTEAKDSSDYRDTLVANVTYYKSEGSKVEVVEKDGLGFVNSYDPEDAEITITAKKVLRVPDGIEKTLQEDFNGKFSLGLYKADENGNILEAQPAFTSVNDNADFKITVPYELPGIYHYVLKEVQGNIPTITYDSRELRVRVTVSDENGMLNAVIEYFVDNTWTNAGQFSNQAIEFVNEFKPAEVAINIQKVLNFTSNGNHGLSGFTFKIEEDGGAEGVALTDENGKAEVIVQFDESHAGDIYEFIVSEVNQNEKDMIYDTTKYEIELEVSVDSNGKLIVTKPNSSEIVSEINLSFTNTYNGSKDVPEQPIDPTPTVIVPPNTKDDSNIMLYGGLMTVIALLVVFLLIAKKNKKAAH